LARIGREQGETLSILEAVIETNERQKLRMVDKIEQGLGGAGSLNSKTIAILGLAFKADTDDMRESPAITICGGLARRGANLRIWDPAAMNEAARRVDSIKDRLYFAENEYDAVETAHALVILTPWNQFRNLDLYKIKSLLAQPYFFDLQNIYKRAEAESTGLHYFGVGR
jgi:UDPglucose 6-dehydrogenase